MKKLSLWLSGIGAGISASVVSLMAHAQGFALATSTEAANNGSFLQTAYNEIINFLSSTGGVLFMIVVAILGVVVWLAVKTPRHVVNA